MMKRYTNKNRRKFSLKMHLIFVTKYKRPILVAGLETCVKEKISDLCLKHKWKIVAMETDKDHIHLLLSYDTTERVSDIVHCLKQETTWELWQKFYYFLCTKILEETYIFGLMVTLLVVLEKYHNPP